MKEIEDSGRRAESSEAKISPQNKRYTYEVEKDSDKKKDVLIGQTKCLNSRLNQRSRPLKNFL